MDSFVGRETLLFDYMRAHGYPVYHQSNLFVRDVQAAIREYAREKEHRDIGTLEVDRLAAEFVADLERRGVAVPFRHQTYILQMEAYRLQPAATEEKTAEAEAPAQTGQ